MKLTNLHIFLIILLALVLCSTLGGTCLNEGYRQRYGRSKSSSYANPQYRGYGSYYQNLDDSAVSASNRSMGLSDDTNNPYYNNNDYFHNNYANHRARGRNQRYRDNQEGYVNNNNYGNDDMNGGDYSDPSGMFSSSYKNSNNKHTNYNSAYRRERTSNKMFDSVSNGAMNGSLFNSANSYSNNYDNNDNDNNDNNDNSGVSSNQIPPGQEDLYILKSQIVPPVCPACPKCPSVNCNDKCGNNKCPPCPACARCPEPQFECKKVPNYSSANIMGNLPIPWADKLDIK
jgi:hypothetical protein